MLGFFKKSKTRRRKPFRSPLLISADAWLNNALYRLGHAFASFWSVATIISKRFRVRGFKRFLVEICDEALTLGLIGFIAFTTLGISIFQMTERDWRAPEDFAVTFLDRHGNNIGSRGALHAESISIDDMPDYVIKAVLATEDRRFFEHYGIDFYGLSRALSTNMRANGVVQGGSTLTQQLAKNMFLTNERTLTRKIKEAYLAIWLEANLSKKEILQLYLDRAYMGGGTFGIAAASKFYFGKDVRNISLAEAAMLAGLFKAPGRYAPHVNLPAARARANIVLSNLVDSGMMSEGQVIGARRNPASVKSDLGGGHPDYFLDWAFDEIRKMGDQLPERTLIVRTTLDQGIQKAAEESIEFHLRQYGQQYRVSQASTVVIDNDGSVRAMVGGRDYGESQFNRATQKGRQAGSSFKPYVYATAMSRGNLTPATIVPDAPINWAGWSPRNLGGYRGRVDLATALARSINSVPVYLTMKYLNRDTQPIRDLIKNMGIDADIIAHKTMVLGTSDMTTLDQATGYNVFANGGMAGNRHGFTQILSPDGRVIWDWNRNGPKPHRVLSEQVAAYLNQMMVGVTTRGSGGRARLPMTLVAGKTGTSQEARDTWFVGFTGNYTAAVWMGNDDNSPQNHAFGGVVPAMIWHRMMLYAHQNVTIKPIYGVENSILSAPKNKDDSPQPDIAADLPQVLSPATSQVIRDIGEAFDKAPTITMPISKIVSSQTSKIQ